MTGIRESWRIFRHNVKPRRIFKEDDGVEGSLIFAGNPTDSRHLFANLLRLAIVIFFPLLFLASRITRFPEELVKQLLWGIEWSLAPDAILLEAPHSTTDDDQANDAPSVGRYAVTGHKPRWLLDVEFKGDNIVSQPQVQYPRSGDVSPEERIMRYRIQQHGYTAISYFMKSAKTLFDQRGGGQLDPQPGEKRKYSLQNRKKISQMMLEEYARARKTIPGKTDGHEFIWLDEFCLSDDSVTDGPSIKNQRDTEVGQLADIFRCARQVLVFCHVPNCEHTSTSCPWGNRLFTLGEILYTPTIHRMTRVNVVGPDGQETLRSSIVTIPGQEFRGEMQGWAAEAERWHLYNIMQHATNSGAVTWQSAIHSLVVEAIRRDDTEDEDDFSEHKFLGKSLNGLLPRRSHLEDLRGINGWADLAWLLELNQGYYNAALLAAVCQLADSRVTEYRWWGDPIEPRVGSERLEALVTAIPVKVRKVGSTTAEPVLSIIGPRGIRLSDKLRRDPLGLYHNREMHSLGLWTLLLCFVLLIVGLATSETFWSVIFSFWRSCFIFASLELLVGTMYLERDKWVVVEDHRIKGDPHHYIRSQDATLATNASEWGPRQLIPRWETNLTLSKGPSAPDEPPQPYMATLLDLKTGVYTRVAVTSRPNDMIVLAVHGNGITCMLLDRDERQVTSTVAAKVGMANLPPYALVQAEASGTVYVGGGVRRGSTTEPPSNTFIPAGATSDVDGSTCLPNHHHPRSPGEL